MSVGRFQIVSVHCATRAGTRLNWIGFGFNVEGGRLCCVPNLPEALQGLDFDLGPTRSTDDTNTAPAFRRAGGEACLGRKKAAETRRGNAAERRRGRSGIAGARGHGPPRSPVAPARGLGRGTRPRHKLCSRRSLYFRLPVCMSTSGRTHGEFLRLLSFLSNK